MLRTRAERHGRILLISLLYSLHVVVFNLNFACVEWTNDSIIDLERLDLSLL